MYGNKSHLYIRYNQDIFLYNTVPPVLYAFADVVHHRLLYQHDLPSPGPRSLQYGLHLQQEPLDKHDQFYLICQGSAGLRILKTGYTPRKAFPCEPRDFFYSSQSSRRGLCRFFLIDRGKNTPQMITMKNDTTYCNGYSSVTQLFATYIDLSGGCIPLIRLLRKGAQTILICGLYAIFTCSQKPLK